MTSGGWDKGYRLKAIVATDDTKKETEITKCIMGAELSGISPRTDEHGNRNYVPQFFTMPESDVSVSAWFILPINVKANEPVYNGAAQELVSEGEDVKGAVLYALQDDKGEFPSDDSFTGKIPSAKDAGTYKVYYKPAGIDSIYPVSVDITIAGKSVTVKANDIKKTVGEKDPEFSATVTGMVNGEKKSLISYSIAREEGEKAGTYRIVPKGEKEQGNYIVSYEEGVMIISEKKPSPKPDDPVNPDNPTNPDDPTNPDNPTPIPTPTPAFKTLSGNAIEAMNKGFAAPGDTTVLTGSGKNYKLEVNSDCQITVVKGNKFFVSDIDGQAEGDYNKELSINKKGKVSAKKPSGNFHFWFNHKKTGNKVTVSINIIEPSIDGEKKLKAETKAGEIFDFATTIPLNAEFGTIKNKGVSDGLSCSGIEAIGEDGKLHIKGTALKKGKVTIPFTVYGKRFKAVIQIKP